MAAEPGEPGENPHSHGEVMPRDLRDLNREPPRWVCVCVYQVEDSWSAPIKVTTSQKYFILDFLRASADVTL